MYNNILRKGLERKHQSLKRSSPKKKKVTWYDNYIKVPIAPNLKGVCLQNASKSHSYHVKIW